MRKTRVKKEHVLKAAYLIIAFLGINSITDILCKRISLLSVILMLAGGILILLLPDKRWFIMGDEEGLWLFYSGLLFGLGLFLLSFATRGAIGPGDGMAAAVCGLYLGIYKVLLLFTAAFFLAGITGAVLMIAKKAGSKTRLSFIPFVFTVYILMILGSIGTN